MDKITELKHKRFLFLHNLYKVTEGDPFKEVDEDDLALVLGLTDSETNQIVSYLFDEGLLDIPAYGGVVSITHQGVVQVEDALSEPKKPTKFFPPVNNIHSHSAIKQSIFISYSRKDEKEKDKLLSHLGVLQKAGLLSIWSDEEIGPGADWKKEIEQAMAQASVAILLVTSNFLNSDFILKKEVPRLLQRRQNEGLIIFPVIAKACDWKAFDWLREMNVYPKNARPVWSDAGSHVDEDLAKIAEELRSIVNRTSPKNTQEPVRNLPPDIPYRADIHFEEKIHKVQFVKSKIVMSQQQQIPPNVETKLIFDRLIYNTYEGFWQESRPGFCDKSGIYDLSLALQIEGLTEEIPVIVIIETSNEKFSRKYYLSRVVPSLSIKKSFNIDRGDTVVVSLMHKGSQDILISSNDDQTYLTIEEIGSNS